MLDRGPKVHRGRNNPKEFVSVSIAANAVGSWLHWDPASPDWVIPFHLIGASFRCGWRVAPTLGGEDGGTKGRGLFALLRKANKPYLGLLAAPQHTYNY